MKNLLLFMCLLVSLEYNLAAQITVTNATFPVAGDTLNVSVVNNPRNISNGSAGVNQLWDFSKLRSNTVRKTAIRPASEGANAADFPTANLMTKLLGANTEEYIRSSSTKYEYLGYAGRDPVGIGFNVSARYSPVDVERRAPMKYLDKNSSNSALLLGFPASVLPDSLLSMFPIKPDSIRIKYTGSRKDTVDAWGMMMVPNGSFDVLREKRVEINDTRFEIKIPFLGWTDVTALIKGSGLPGVSFLDKDTSLTYYYFSNVAKEPIAVVAVNRDSGTITSVTYKAISITTAVDDLFDSETGPSMTAFPNPALDEVRFDLFNLESGNYTLKIFNLLGSVVWQQRYVNISGNRSYKEDISSLRKGNYFFALINDKGKIISTKRLIIARP